MHSIQRDLTSINFYIILSQIKKTLAGLSSLLGSLYHVNVDVRSVILGIVL